MAHYLNTTQEFEDELDLLADSDPNTVGLIDALIDEMQADEGLLSTLDHDVPKWHFTFAPPFEIKRFEACWRSRPKRYIYVLKPYDEDGSLIDYRIFIAHDIQSCEYFVLTVQPRGTCYDTTTPAHRQLCDRYDQLNISSTW